MLICQCKKTCEGAIEGEAEADRMLVLLQVRARFVERFSMGAPYSGGEVRGPAFSDVTEKVDWVEKFVRLGTKATEAARSEHDL